MSNNTKSNQPDQPDKQTETMVLQLTDLVIEQVIAAGLLEGDEREWQVARATDLVVELGDLLLLYLGDKTQYFETLLRQVIKQRLPEQRILGGFAGFNHDLETVLNRGTEVFLRQKAKAEENAPETTTSGENDARVRDSLDDHEAGGGAVLLEVIEGPVEARVPKKVVLPGQAAQALRRPGDPLEKALRYLYPRERVLRDYQVHGITLPYYLPGVRLALQIGGADPQKVRECQERDIKLLCLEAGEVFNPRHIQRKINRLTLALRAW